jgi:hypothetical protein
MRPGVEKATTLALRRVEPKDVRKVTRMGYAEGRSKQRELGRKDFAEAVSKTYNRGFHSAMLIAYSPSRNFWIVGQPQNPNNAHHCWLGRDIAMSIQQTGVYVHREKSNRLCANHVYRLSNRRLDGMVPTK